MSLLFSFVLDSPLLQISIVFTAMTVGLFIAAAAQRRLQRFTALLLSLMLAGSCSLTALGGTLSYFSWIAHTQPTAMEREAMASLAAGDGRDAYEKAVESVKRDAKRPSAWLIAARAALIQGDLTAADHYYGMLGSLPEEEQKEWGIDQNAEEIDQWKEISGLSGEQQRNAAQGLATTVEKTAQAETEELPALRTAADNHAALLDMEKQIRRSQSGTDGTAIDTDTIDSEMEELTGLDGAADARALRQDFLVLQQEWERLLAWLMNDGTVGLMDLADRVLDGTIPEEALQQLESGETDTARLLIRELADTLWESRGQAGTDLARLYLTLAKLNASEYINDMDAALKMMEEALGTQTEDEAVLQEMGSLRLWMETADTGELEGFLSEWSGNETLTLEEETGGEAGAEGADAQTSAGLTAEPTAEATPEATGETLQDGLAGETIRTDLTPFFNICAPELTTPGVIRFYVTMAEGSGGFPEGEPEASDFAFRTNVGFQRELAVNSMTLQANVEKYTMLLIDRRPTMTAEAIDLAQAAAVAYVQSMPEGEKVVVYGGGIPEGYVSQVFPAGTTYLFADNEAMGNNEMGTFLFSGDKALLEQFIMEDYAGDAYDNPDIVHIISWALNQMTAISPAGVSGDWQSFPLTAAIPRFGQVIMFTNGHPGETVMAGGPKTIEYIRGGAIAANAAVHIVAVDPVEGSVDLAALAEAGRGSYIDPAADSLTAFYNFVRNRQVRVFLADCVLPEDPVDSFFELWAQHTPTGVMAGFARNPGRGVDLVGTLQYSDATLSGADFHDYTGDGPDEGTGGDSFGNEEDQTGGDTTGDMTGDEMDGGTLPDVTDWPGMDTLRVDGLDRHAIARNESGLLLVNLLGQGFEGLSPADIAITFPGLGRIQTAFIDVADDNTIRFFLPVTLASGMYSMRVTIGGQVFLFTDTLWIYDADNFTTITFGEWTITAASAQETDGGDWTLSGTAINDYVHFTGETLVSGDWLTESTDELTLTPGGEAYIAFDPESDDYLVKEIFLDNGADLVLGSLEPITLLRSGEGAPFYSIQIGNVLTETLSLGILDIPYDEGVLYPDRVEVPCLDINLDLPLQEYLLMSENMLPCSATAAATFAADIDSIDLALTAGLESDRGLKFMSALSLSELTFEIDTAAERIAIDLGVKLVGDDGFKAHLALKGDMLDEITITIDTDIPVTTTPPSPIPVKITELGGGVENLSALASGDPVEMLGVTIVGLAELEAGNAADLIPFLTSLPWLPADEIPPVLATENTSLKLRPWPFTLAFSTDLSLFGEFPVGHAELTIGYYAFEQTLLGISDEEAVGLHALVEVGPDFDFSIVRLGYSAGPSLDINNHGLFLAANGAAWVGFNLGPVEFTADMEGTFLVAVHGIEGSDWPQISIVANAAPSAGIPGLWSAGETKDVRLLINEYGFRLVGIPSPIDAALDWLSGKIDDAAAESWETVTDGMDAVGEAAGMTWDLMGDGVDLAGEGIDTVVDTMTDGLGTLYDTGADVVEDAGEFFEDASDAAGEAGDTFTEYAEDGYSGFESTAEDVYNWLTS